MKVKIELGTENGMREAWRRTLATMVNVEFANNFPDLLDPKAVSDASLAASDKFLDLLVKHHSFELLEDAAATIAIS